MENEKEKEDSLNPEEDTSEEKTQDEQTEEKSEGTSSELEEKNKRLYARAKKAEEDLKKLKEELEKLKKPASKPSSEPTDVLELAKTVSALKEYSPEELDFIAMVARDRGISPTEAAKTEEA